MYSAATARRDMYASGKFNKNGWTWSDEWQYRRILRKIRRAAKKGKQNITVNSLYINVEKKLEWDGYKVEWAETRSENIYYIISWGHDNVISDAECRRRFNNR